MKIVITEYLYQNMPKQVGHRDIRVKELLHSVRPKPSGVILYKSPKSVALTRFGSGIILKKIKDGSVVKQND